MSWRKYIVIIFVVIFTLAGCEAKKADGSGAGNNGTNPSVETTPSSPENLSTENFVLYDSLHIVTGVFINRQWDDVVDISIEYPQLHQSGNEVMDLAIENKINRQIFESIIGEDDIIWHPTRLNIKVDYQIACYNENILSIIFYERYRSNDESGIFKTLNFDLHTGKLLSLCDYFSNQEIDDIASNYSNNYDYYLYPDIYSQSEIHEFDEFKKFMSEGVANAYAGSYDNYNKYNFYIKDGKLGLFFCARPYLNGNFAVEIEIDLFNS